MVPLSSYECYTLNSLAEGESMFTQFAVLGIGTTELLLILAIIVLLFGAKKLPELSRSLGDSARELRKGMGSGNEDKKKQADRKEAEDARNS
jgi:sec-independent protein translocase protein TatA